MNENQFSTPFLLGQTQFLVSRKSFKRIVQHGIDLTIEQLGMLFILAQKKEIIQTDLADWLGKDKSAVLRHLDCLEGKQLIIRVSDVSDRRRKMLVMTKAGNELLAKAKEIINEVFQEISKDIPAEKMETFREVLNLLKENSGCEKNLPQ